MVIVTAVVGAMLLCGMAALLLLQHLRVRRSRTRARAIIDSSLDAIVQMDAQGAITGWNRQAEKLFGWSRHEALGRKMHETIVPPRYRDTHLRHVQRYVHGGVSSIMGTLVEIHALHRDGSEFPVELVVTNLDNDGHHEFNAFIRDIRPRKAAQARLTLAASVFTHAHEGIMITDVRGCILDVNDMFCTITGYERAEVLGRNPSLLQSGRQGAEFYAAMWQSLAATGHWSSEIWNRRKNGELYAETITIRAVRDEGGTIQHYVALFTDISNLKETQRQLEHIAHYDALTGLPNRVLLADRLRQIMGQALRQQHWVAIACLDIDGFKAINDRYGHLVGDKLLVTLAERMQAVLRAGDTLARIGGDEFVVVISDALEQAAVWHPLLEQLLQAAATPMVAGDSVLRVSASIGVTLYPQDKADADQLLRHADQAMYLAKQAGRNCMHLFDVAHDMAVQTQRESLEHIRSALENNEFVLYYQPKVNMQTGAVVGAEALIRWQHPVRGLLAPSMFLPIIEDHDLGVALGEWVLHSALTQMAQWQAQGLELSVSVNISARQLQRGDCPLRLERLLAQHPGVAAHKLELEILETSALEDIQQVSEDMLACQRLGVRFALDDFGTGYSSLTYLRHLPAKIIKIDQSFVRDMLVDADDLAIVKAVIGLASAFGREVVAEGVESMAHGAALLQLGCQLAQGYGIARPMPAPSLPEWISHTWPASAPAWSGGSHP